MALSRNNAGRDNDGASRVVEGGNEADDVGIFEWLQEQLAPSSNFMDPQESQGSNDVAPEASNINNPESQDSNNITITSDHHMVNDTNYTSAISQGHHVDGSATHVTLNGDPPRVSPFNQFSCGCDDDDDDDWITEVIESGILNICERGR